jgi:uncharacterized protein YqfA (UPF0365 family)
MRISFVDFIFLKLQGLPVGRIRKAMALSESARLSLSLHDICSHLLAGGSPESVLEALILARREGVPTSWSQLCAIDLASVGQQEFTVLSAVQASIPLREFTFSTFAPDLTQPLAGICRDGSRLQAQCRIQYHLDVSHVFGQRLNLLQERLAARIAALMFDAANPQELRISQAAHETSLLVLAQTVMPTVKEVALTFERAE